MKLVIWKVCVLVECIFMTPQRGVEEADVALGVTLTAEAPEEGVSVTVAESVADPSWTSKVTVDAGPVCP